MKTPTFCDKKHNFPELYYRHWNIHLGITLLRSWSVRHSTALPAIGFRDVHEWWQHWRIAEQVLHQRDRTRGFFHLCGDSGLMGQRMTSATSVSGIRPSFFSLSFCPPNSPGLCPYCTIVPFMSQTPPIFDKCIDSRDFSETRPLFTSSVARSLLRAVQSKPHVAAKTNHIQDHTTGHGHDRAESAHVPDEAYSLSRPNLFYWLLLSLCLWFISCFLATLWNCRIHLLPDQCPFKKLRCLWN